MPTITAPVVTTPVILPVIKPVAQMTAEERKAGVLSHLEKCLPQIQNMPDFSQFLLNCLTQESGELYLPSKTLLNELTAGLNKMRTGGINFTDPEIVHTLLYGDGTSQTEKVLKLLPGYTDVVATLSKIVSGAKIDKPSLEAIEAATIKEMAKIPPTAVQVQQVGSGRYRYIRRGVRFDSFY